MKDKITYYETKEERINIISHALGLVLSIIALILLLVYTPDYGETKKLVSFAIYGASLIILYSASTFYHYAQKPELRKKLNIFDHAAIYVLIAGTYTPFCLVVLPKKTGWIIFGISWSIAIAGIVFKLFFTGRFEKLSTTMYVVMGWIIIFAVKPLMENLPANGLWWLLAGGIFYTAGAILYSLNRIKYNHAVFHIFVLLGSFSHFLAVFFYVLPLKS